MIIYKVLILTNLVLYIKKILYSLFFSNSEDVSMQKALRNIMQEIKQCKYPVYRSDNAVLPGFPMIIYELYTISQPLKNLLKETICSNDIRISNFFLDKLVEISFSEEQKRLKECISLNNRLLKFPDLISDDFDQKMKEQAKEFDDLLFSLSEPAFKVVDIKINKLFSFFDFCTYQFNHFFSHFDSSFNAVADTDTIREHYNFTNVDGMEVLQDILDLGYLIKNISLDEEFIEGMMCINAILPPEKKEEEIYLKKRIKNFAFTIETSLRKNTIQNLAKLIKKDPHFDDQTKAPKTFSEMEEYKTRLISNFNTDTKKILKLRQDAQMVSLIDALFGNTEMLTLNVYTEELNNRIQNITKLSLEWIKPLEILKTYTKSFFGPKIEPFLRELLVEGLFEDKKMQSNFAVDYYYCSAIVEKIDELEQVMYGKNESPIDLITGYLARIETGGDFEKTLSKVIEEINLRAKKFLEEAGKHYLDLLKFCNIIVKDTYKAVPENVHNITSIINSTKNKERFAIFANEMENFEKMIELLKKYVVIDIPEIN